MKDHGPSIYYASDKNICDALNQGKVSINSLQRIFFDRGIIVSAETKKENLSKYFSRLNYDFYDQSAIGNALKIRPHRDRITSCFVTTDQKLNMLEDVAIWLKGELEKRGDSVNVQLKNNRLVVEIDYVNIDYKRSELTQVRRQKGVLEITESTEGYVVRNTQTTHINEITEVFLTEAKEQSSKVSTMTGTTNTFEVNTISLETITDHGLRSEFFDLLMNNLSGYRLEDVSAAYVYKLHPDEIESLGTEVDDEELPSADEDDVRIERASLKGKGVHRSSEIKSLHDQDFYAVRTSWTAIDKSNTRFDLDATFANPDSCSGFSYMLRRIREEEGENHLHLRQRAPTRTECDDIYVLIEESAKSAVISIRAKHHGN